MRISDLLFIGIKGSVVALNRATGEQVWAARLKGWDAVVVVVEDGKVLATAFGEIFCLDPLTGNLLWHNRLKGFGTGLASIASTHNPQTNTATVMVEEACRRRETAA